MAALRTHDDLIRAGPLGHARRNTSRLLGLRVVEKLDFEAVPESSDLPVPLHERQFREERQVGKRFALGRFLLRLLVLWHSDADPHLH